MDRYTTSASPDVGTCERALLTECAHWTKGQTRIKNLRGLEELDERVDVDHGHLEVLGEARGHEERAHVHAPGQDVVPHAHHPVEAEGVALQAEDRVLHGLLEAGRLRSTCQYRNTHMIKQWAQTCDSSWIMVVQRLSPTFLVV